MKFFHPYQPLLLRILHGLTGFFVLAAIVTAYWTYTTYDGRWGQPIPLPHLPEIEGIHGTFGLYALLIFPLFVLYAFRPGQKRLLPTAMLPKLVSKSAPVGTPAWWYTLHRLVNTLAIVALTFALFSGKMMDETWLPKGELNHGWYLAHLISWVVMVSCIALHLLMTAKVGGVPLLLSMVHWSFRSSEHPKYWLPQIQQWWQQSQLPRLPGWLQLASSFQGLEAIVLISIAAAWLIPLI